MVSKANLTAKDCEKDCKTNQGEKKTLLGRSKYCFDMDHVNGLRPDHVETTPTTKCIKPNPMVALSSVLEWSLESQEAETMPLLSAVAPRLQDSCIPQVCPRHCSVISTSISFARLRPLSSEPNMLWFHVCALSLRANTTDVKCHKLLQQSSNIW